jgi:hypothetical protein
MIKWMLVLMFLAIPTANAGFFSEIKADGRAARDTNLAIQAAAKAEADYAIAEYAFKIKQLKLQNERMQLENEQLRLEKQRLQHTNNPI